MKHVGTINIETERLILRSFKKTDALDMYNNWANDERVTRYLTLLPHESIEESEQICELWEKESSLMNKYQWIIILKESNKAIGSIGAVNIYEDTKALEVGYCIGYGYWGKGYVKEALIDILKVFKEVGFVRVFAEHDVENPNSGKVLEKCGFEYEGTARKSIYNHERVLVDMAIYSIIFEENI